MDITQIENNLKILLSAYTEDSFIYGLLSAYGIANASVSRLKKGDYNLSKNAGEVLWKKKVFFKKETNADLHSAIDKLSKTPAITKQHPRFIIVTDFKTLLALDTDNADTLDIPFKDLTRHFDFFLPWAGMEKSQFQSENPADIKAAERMGRLYDLILEENPIEDEKQRHSLNVFFTRLLFCYFAEDTGIFPQSIFVNGVASHTAEDGSDLQTYLTKLFRVLNTQDRKSCPNFLVEYPYVNGGLFATESPAPRFNTRSRKLLIECGALNWKAINPDIFGSMMQAVVHTDERSGKGMHYTSVVNIMKVIEPLFLNHIRAELEQAGSDKQKLNKLLERLYNLRIFDPACGSGNFLIIAYKELCKIEIDIFKKLNHGQMSFRFQSKLKLDQFCGIEIDDFAHETAKLSLWLTEHQMNLAFKEVFGDARPTLPLQDGGNIVHGNASQLNWDKICPRKSNEEIYLLGNPPYVGARVQNEQHKSDMEKVFKNIKGYNNLDYVACWFLKGAEYIRYASAKLAFVATSSICQGVQVGLLWPHVLLQDLEISFAHTSFKWENNARNNAGVICVIVGLQNKATSPKYIYSLKTIKKAGNINAYLAASPNRYLDSRTSPISELPPMVFGSMPNDGGHLLLNTIEKSELIKNYPEAESLIRKFIGAEEYLNGQERWCLWISDADRERAQRIPPIQNRIELVRKVRLESKRGITRSLADVPHRFGEIRHKDIDAIIFPCISSSRREYIPVGLTDKRTIVNNKAYIIFDSNPFIIGLLSSRIHMTWVATVAGRLKNDFNYSALLCWNNFPVPKISKIQKDEINDRVLQIFDQRELYPEKTMAQLYDPDIMPDGLRNAHQELDVVIDQCYRSKEFSDDEERLEYLFKLYSEMAPNRKQEELISA